MTPVAATWFLYLQYALPASVGEAVLWMAARRMRIPLFRWELLALVLPFVLWYLLVMVFGPRGWWRFFSYLPLAGGVVAILGGVRLPLSKRIGGRRAAGLTLLADCGVVFLFWYFWPCMLNEPCK